MTPTDLGPRPLKNLTAADLRPIWSRLDIPIERIATSLGVTRQALRSKAKTLGLPSRSGNVGGKKPVSDEEFARYWSAGLTMSGIAKICGYKNHNGVSQRRRSQGLPPRVKSTTKGDGIRWEGTITLAQFYEQEVVRLMGEKR